LDLSKLKLDIYDFLAIILPGLLAVAESWILLRGWTAFVFSMSHMSGTGLTLLLVFAFGIGHIVQELGDFVIQFVKGERYLRKARDEFWKTDDGKIVRHAIKLEFGHDIHSVDDAYDYCLTRLKGHFDKRDIFVATSDLCRSLIVLSVLAIAPACRIAFCNADPLRRSFAVFASVLVFLSIVAALAWRRMDRYSKLSQVTVFRAYLGVTEEREARSSSPQVPSSDHSKA
jgi:hypothetical protein